MTLTPAQAKARTRVIVELGRVSAHAQAAIRHAAHNHRGRARRSTAAAGKALHSAHRALLALDVLTAEARP